MREFVCTQCGHEFTVDSCNGRRGWQITCPQCNSPVRRINFLNTQNPGLGQGVRAGRSGQKGNWCRPGRGGGGGMGIGRGRGWGQGPGAKSGLGFGSVNVNNT
ncbi:zinc ribbon domain-containing protein [Desulfolucanica intricata]|uniref:zinc ribbon domain-containing protein n=1 Tax=Desulfolucanica intricata TaxID=1285191 RepID=UPI0008370DFF|nr:zinc ribbon domain-containing protein [Desulfolucanica intricata]